MIEEDRITVTLDRLGAELERAERRIMRRRSQRRLMLGAPLAVAAIATSAAVAGLSPWPGGSSVSNDNGVPVLSLQGDTSHPFDPATPSDVALLQAGQLAISAAQSTRQPFTPRGFSPPTDGEVAYGTCTQFAEALVSCGSTTHHFYLVKGPAGDWLPAGECVSTTTISVCTYPFRLAIDTAGEAPTLTPLG